MRVDFRQPTPEDIAELVENISPEDRNEILAMGVTPEWGVRNSIKSSLECVAILNEGRLACITGVVVGGGVSDSVYPWLIGTSYMQEFPFTVLRLSRRILSRWQGMFPEMSNYVDARHTRAIHWLRHLGAEIDPPVPYGPWRRPFHPFHFRSA